MTCLFIQSQVPVRIQIVLLVTGGSASFVLHSSWLGATVLGVSLGVRTSLGLYVRKPHSDCRYPVEPSHDIMALFVLRKLTLKMCMRSHSVGLDVWCLVRPYVYFHTLCVQTKKVLARLRRCAGSPEPSLVAYVISTIISWAGLISLKPMEILDFNSIGWKCVKHSWQAVKPKSKNDKEKAFYSQGFPTIAYYINRKFMALKHKLEIINIKILRCFVFSLNWYINSLNWYINWAPSSEFVSSSIPSWQIVTAQAQPCRGTRDLAFCLKVPLDSLLLMSEQWRFWGDCADAQARLNLRCSHRR